MDHQTCEAFVATCIDFRFQDLIDNWIKKHFGTKNHDRVSIAGGVKEQEAVLAQLAISLRLHHIKRAVLINHEDCGAYGQEGTAQKHAEDLRRVATEVKRQFPGLAVETYYLHLDGNFEQMK